MCKKKLGIKAFFFNLRDLKIFSRIFFYCHCEKNSKVNMCFCKLRNKNLCFFYFTILTRRLCFLSMSAKAAAKLYPSVR